MTEHTASTTDGQGANAHPAWLAHHFHSARQQYESGKLGIWIFLLTEVLFFSGLFCVYAVYRANHPAVFVDGHHLLSTPLGAINTIVLIFSSLTMAWAVRCTQVDQRKAAAVLLAVTLFCAGTFLVVKGFEYHHKWKHGLIPAHEFAPDEHYLESRIGAHEDGSTLGRDPAQRVRNVRTFVGIYFGMTGLHALHVVAGIIAIVWVLRRTVRGDFNRQYFGPVDFVGLYWHLVDLIWIYLFPLLYLIH